MAGKICPKCGQFTFFETVSGRKCTKCGYTMIVPANEGKGGRGQKCSNCGQFTVFNGNVELVELLTNKEMVKWQGENVLNVERTHLS